MDLQSLKSPLTFLGDLINEPELTSLKDYEAWWHAEAIAISEAVDRAGTPWLRMFDQFGRRVDEILFPPDYWKMLKKGYETGAIWRACEGDSLKMHYLIDYVTCFFDAGLGCPYIVSLSTTVPLKKYGSPELQKRFLPHLLRRDGTNWQGATWMTEIKGGSDLGANVETIARSEPPAVAGGPMPAPDSLWLLTGDKYFASNVGAELAIVAARPEGAPPGPKGLALFLVPRYGSEPAAVAGGPRELNYFIRRLKNKIRTPLGPNRRVEPAHKEAFPTRKLEWGNYLNLRVPNPSSGGNIVGSV